VAFRVHEPLGTKDAIISRLTITAHLFAYLRINPGVTSGTAKLTTGWLGSALAGRVSHPLDD
jgi:hypothetical protein